MDKKMKTKNHHFVIGDRVCLKSIGKNKSTQDMIQFLSQSLKSIIV
jgi:hypothetical protein